MNNLLKTIVIANPKGGCGKSTLAAQIASHYANQGFAVALADHDPQRSSLDWLKCRPSGCSSITPIAAFNKVSVSDTFDVVIHDMPAASDLDMILGAVTGRAKLLIPILPSPTDIKAGVRFLMSLNREGWNTRSTGGESQQVDIGLVANRVRTNTNYFKVLVEFLEQVNMPLIASIRDTQNYIRAMDAGISVFDLPPSRVARDLQQWQLLLNWLDDKPDIISRDDKHDSTAALY